MGGIPDSWIEIEIADVASVVGGGTPKASDPENFEVPGEGIAWLTPADLSGYSDKYIGRGKRDISLNGYGSSSAKLMPENSILFTSRAPIGYVAIAANEIATNQGFKSLVFGEGIDPSYAYYFLRSINDLAQSRGTGTTFKELSGAATKKLPFVLAPAAEQTRIANRLDELLAQVDTINARVDTIPCILKRFRQSVLAAAVSGRLTEEWRARKEVSETTGDLAGRIASERSRRWDIECERVGRKRKYKLPVEGESADLPGIPDGWKWMSVDALSTKVVDGVHKKPVYHASGVPFVTVKNLTAGPGISFVNLNYVSEEDHQEFFKRANPDRGDILISKGSRKYNFT